MLRRSPDGHMHEVFETAFVDITAIIYGKEIIEDNIFIGPYTVICSEQVNEQDEIEAILIKPDNNTCAGLQENC